MNHKLNLVKKILKIIITLVALFCLATTSTNKLYAQEEDRLCCPIGYSDSFWECPFIWNRKKTCCKTTSPITWDFLPKIPCSEVDEFQESQTALPAAPDLTAKTLQTLNPLYFLGGNSELHEDGRLNVAGTINRLLSFLFPIAGLILFVMLVWGGFEMLTGAASKKNLDAGKQRITAAITGFILLFISYWLTQIIEYITGVKIL